jgi:hypothetical protein
MTAAHKFPMPTVSSDLTSSEEHVRLERPVRRVSVRISCSEGSLRDSRVVIIHREAIRTPACRRSDRGSSD